MTGSEILSQYIYISLCMLQCTSRISAVPSSSGKHLIDAADIIELWAAGRWRRTSSGCGSWAPASRLPWPRSGSSRTPIRW